MVFVSISMWFTSLPSGELVSAERFRRDPSNREGDLSTVGQATLGVCARRHSVSGSDPRHSRLKIPHRSPPQMQSDTSANSIELSCPRLVPRSSVHGLSLENSRSVRRQTVDRPQAPYGRSVPQKNPSERSKVATMTTRTNRSRNTSANGWTTRPSNASYLPAGGRLPQRRTFGLARFAPPA